VLKCNIVATEGIKSSGRRML